jgi:hypothetical protein
MSSCSGHHEGAGAAQPQSNLGISLAKAQRRKVFMKLLFFRPWRLRAFAGGVSESELFYVSLNW